MKRLIVAAAAASDLREIARYTEREWGSAQKTRYLQAIETLIRRLCEHSSLGLARDEIHPGYRSLACEQHVFFYRDRSDAVEIIRILHGNMDFRRHFHEPDEG
jgi:toxin ParE1/3/4